MSDGNRQHLREAVQSWTRKYRSIISNNLPSPSDLSVGPVFVFVFPQEKEFWRLLGCDLLEETDIYVAGEELAQALNQTFEAEKRGVRFQFLYDPKVGYAVVIDSVVRQPEDAHELNQPGCS
jgi:hypothetical protein